MNNLFTENTDFGVTAGAGVKFYYLGNRVITIDYAYKAMGVLGNIHTYTVGFSI